MMGALGVLDAGLRRLLAQSRAASEPLVISLVRARFEDGAWSGVPRFDWELRKALPELISLANTPATRLALAWLARRRPDAIVIAANETSLAVPDALRTIVVHHGCAQTHFDRDPEWRGRRQRRLCTAQRKMFTRSNRYFVAPSAWVAQQFAEHYAVPIAPLMMGWVPGLGGPTEPPAVRAKPARPVVLGDFRTWNKGRDVVPRLAARLPQLEFRPLLCRYETRAAAYAQADAFLSLSVSEGGSYAVCDAEVLGLPLVMTDVGNCQEFQRATVLPWQARDDVEQVARALERALGEVRGESFYARFSFEAWQSAWRALLAQVARR